MLTQKNAFWTQYTIVFVLLLFINFHFCLGESEPQGIVLPERLPDHPRLFLTDQRLAEIRTEADKDPVLAKLIQDLVSRADTLLKERNSEYLIPDGKRLLGESRRSISRTTAFAFAYRWTGRKEYAEAARNEMKAVCQFKDWNISHYLDTAEMCTSVALGYDWLYDVIPDEERKLFRETIRDYALKTGLEIYERKRWWTVGKHNWNEVCNSGLTLGAFAIAEDERELAQAVLQSARVSIPNGLSSHAPDGAYPEGPGGYWAYGTTYTCLMIAAYQDILGGDQGLLATSGLARSGEFYISMVGPLQRCFNYADGGEKAAAAPILFFFAKNYNRPDYAVQNRIMIRDGRFLSDRFAVFQVIWYTSVGSEDDLARFPLAAMFRGKQDVASMRTSWTDPNAAFVGFKGGDNTTNHGHLDIGSFVYDSGGVRWACELGADDYNLPGYFGKNRWDYLRNTNKSHSTLVIGGQIQNLRAVGRIVHFEMGKDGDVVALVRIDMSQAYEGQVSSALRTFTLKKSGELIIQDELEGVREPIRWGMVTEANIKVKGKRALLWHLDKTLEVVIESDAVEQFEEMSLQPDNPVEKSNKGYALLGATATPLNEKVRIIVRMGMKR